MELTYENMLNFMQQYCKDYSQWCNEPGSIAKLEQYYATDFVTKAYMHLEERPYPFEATLSQFKDFIMQSHTNILHEEKIIPREILIDEKKNKAIMLLRVKKTVEKSGEVFDFDALAIYQLALAQNGTLKITSLEIITDRPTSLTQLVRS